MALAIDASSPAIATSTAAGTTTITSASFTPPAGALLLVRWSWNSQANTAPPAGGPTITDSLGAPLTYTRQDWQSRNDLPTRDGQAAHWTAVVGSSTAMTVTVTSGLGAANNGGALQVLVLTGQDATTPVGAHGKVGSNNASSIAQSYTAQATGGWGFLSDCDWDLKGAQTAGAGCTLTNGGSANVASLITYGFSRRTSADDVNTASNTLNATLPTASANLGWVYVEILPAAGGTTSAIAGIATSTTTATGAVTARLALAGTATTTTSAAGTVTATLTIAATAATTSTATGALTVVTPVAGAAATTTTATGNLTIVTGAATLAIAGTASSTTTAVGAVGVFTPIAGTAASTTTATGNLTLASGPITWSIAGAATSTTAATGAVTLRGALAGDAASTSTATGTLTLRVVISGTATTTTSATGAAGIRYAIAGGVAASLTAASGAVTLGVLFIGSPGSMALATNAGSAAGGTISAGFTSSSTSGSATTSTIGGGL